MTTANHTVRSLAGERLATMGRLRRMGKRVLVDLAEKQLPATDAALGLWFVRTRKGNALLLLSDRRVMLIEPAASTDVPLDQLTGVDLSRGRVRVQGPPGTTIEALGEDAAAAAAAIRAAR